MSIKFTDWVLEQTEGTIGHKEPILKKEIKKVYKKQPRLSKSVVIYKPKLTFDKGKNE